jgi:hypothetical protein
MKMNKVLLNALLVVFFAAASLLPSFSSNEPPEDAKFAVLRSNFLFDDGLGAVLVLTRDFGAHFKGL